MQVNNAYHIDALEILKGSKLLRSSARALKVHSCCAAVVNDAIQLLSMLLGKYRNSSCFDALAEEIVDSGLPLEIEIAVRSFLVSILCHDKM